MIQRFVDQFMGKKEILRAEFSKKHPERYVDIVRAVVSQLERSEFHNAPDPDRIVEIDHGDYQGTLLFVIGERRYQPHNYWAVLVGYGSCSGCDTLERIRSYAGDEEAPTPQQVEDYMLLALHVVQKLLYLGEDAA